LLCRRSDMARIWPFYILLLPLYLFDIFWYFLISFDRVSGHQVAEGLDDTLAHGHSRRTAEDELTHGCQVTRTLRVCDWQNLAEFPKIQTDSKQNKLVARELFGRRIVLQGWAKGCTGWQFYHGLYCYVLLGNTETDPQPFIKHWASHGKWTWSNLQVRSGSVRPMALFVRWVRSALICEYSMIHHRIYLAK